MDLTDQKYYQCYYVGFVHLKVMMAKACDEEINTLINELNKLKKRMEKMKKKKEKET